MRQAPHSIGHDPQATTQHGLAAGNRASHCEAVDDYTMRTTIGNTPNRSLKGQPAKDLLSRNIIVGQ
jgi:hypothetical protein